MILRGSLIALVLTGSVFAAVKPLPVEDPPPYVVKNASGLFGDTWGIRVGDQPAPVGIIKIYSMDNEALAIMQGAGDCYNLKPGQAVKVAICPEEKPEGAVVALTLDFAKASLNENLPASASVRFQQTTPSPAKPAPVPFDLQPIRGKVKVDKAAYLSADAETPFVTLGKN
jgi:hypothetical protein